MARRRARELAFRTLFQAERSGSDLTTVWQQVREDLALEGLAPDQPEGELDEAYGDRLDGEGVAFAGRLLAHFAEHREDIDRTLAGIIEGWSFSQMAQTDLNVLRLALSELGADPATPLEVVVEMAVRTAKKFGGEDSGRFVHGVLARVLRARAAAAS